MKKKEQGRGDLDVQEAGKGQDVGLAVAARVRKNDRVFRVEKI